MCRAKSYLSLARFALAVSLAATGAVGAEQLTVIGFNVESGDADAQTLAGLIADIDGCDVWGFSEVRNQKWGEVFEEAAEVGEDADFQLIHGTTGGGDRLAIVFDSDRLECLGHSELDHVNIMGRVRAPLVGRFRVRDTGAEFLFMVNHLYRSKADARHRQAGMLNEWAKEQELPVIAVGDYNFDWEVPTGKHDKGYDLMTAGEVFTWIRPEKMVRTHCHPRYDSVLDFVFVSGSARDWAATCEVLFADDEGYCPDDDKKSDHFPMRATFTLPKALAAEVERTAESQPVVESATPP